MRGIDAAAAYVPRGRLKMSELSDAWGRASARGISEKAVPNVDEDTLTMAAAAVDRLFAKADFDRDDVGFVGFASTTPPMEEDSHVARLRSMTGLATEVVTRSYTDSTVDGGSAIEDALAADGTAIAVVADAPTGDPADEDHRFGGAAVAVLCTDDAAVPFVDAARHVAEAPGTRFRERGSTDVRSLGVAGYERDRIRSQLAAVTEGLSVDVGSVHGVAVHQPDEKTPYRATKGLADAGAVERGTIVDRIGDIGAAGVPLGLLAALEANEPDDAAVGLFYGSGGGALALCFEGSLDAGLDEALDDGETLSYAAYLRRRSYVGVTPVSGGGANIPLPTWQRGAERRYRLTAGICSECGRVNFPTEGACTHCHELADYEPVSLPPAGTVAARTVVGHGGAPPEFADFQSRTGPFVVAVIKFETPSGVVRVPGQVADADPADVAVGDVVVPAIRRIYEQEGVVRYGAKFVLAASD